FARSRRSWWRGCDLSLPARVGPGGPGGCPLRLPQTLTCSHSSIRPLSRPLRHPRKVPVALRPIPVDMRMNLDVFSMPPSVEPADRRLASLHGVLRGEFPAPAVLSRRYDSLPHFVACP